MNTVKGNVKELVGKSLNSYNAKFVNPMFENTDKKLDSIKEQTERIENKLDSHLNASPGTSGRKYGVRMYKNSSNPILERVGDAMGLTAHAGVGDGYVTNDFDNIYPWGKRRLCNLSQEGKVLAYEGEPGFKSDGSNGNVMVETPIFYQKYVETDEYIEWWIADYNAPGFRLSPIFLTKNREVLNKIYTGAYEASNAPGTTSTIQSASGYFPRVEAGRHAFRNMAKDIGVDWGLTDIAYRCDILFYLFVIEFATLNSQSVMQGLTTLQWEYKTTAPTESGNVLTLNSSNIVVGFTLRINNTDRRVTSVNKNTMQVTVDGEPFSIKSDVSISSRGWMCGETDSVIATSGSMISNSDGKNPCKYRGEENPWGNLWEWVDGCNIKDHQAYVHWVPSEYKDDFFEAPYEKLGYVNAKSNSYTKAMGYDKNNPYVALPTIVGGSSSTYYCDYYYQNTGNRAPLVGATLNTGSDAGLVYWDCSTGFSNSYRNIGARLSYKPS